MNKDLVTYAPQDIVNRIFTARDKQVAHWGATVGTLIFIGGIGLFVWELLEEHYQW